MLPAPVEDELRRLARLDDDLVKCELVGRGVLLRSNKDAVLRQAEAHIDAHLVLLVKGEGAGRARGHHVAHGEGIAALPAGSDVLEVLALLVGEAHGVIDVQFPAAVRARGDGVIIGKIQPQPLRNDEEAEADRHRDDKEKDDGKP